jgi:hypothetical protein
LRVGCAREEDCGKGESPESGIAHVDWSRVLR